MKIEELMIGNLIMHGDLQVKVRTINFESEYLVNAIYYAEVEDSWSANLCHNFAVKVSECSGIQLNELILQKCHELKYEYLGYGITQYKIGYLQLQTLNDGEYHLSCNGCHLSTIKYLHNLQNIIQVFTGKPLKIEL